jgi:hypothetical protein
LLQPLGVAKNLHGGLTTHDLLDPHRIKAKHAIALCTHANSFHHQNIGKFGMTSQEIIDQR